MKHSIYILLVAVCSGCDIHYDSRSDIPAYTCSTTQLDMVKKQSDICNDNGYLGSYCWDLARAEQCQAVTGAKP